MNIYILLSFRPFFVYVEDELLSDAAKYYYTGSDAPLTPVFTKLPASCGGICIHDIIDGWITHVPTDNDVLWMVINKIRAWRNV